MNKLFLLPLMGLTLIFASSCGSITKMIEKHRKVSKIVETKVYDVSLADMKVKVVEYFGGWRQTNPNESAVKIKEEIDKGFVYNKQYFQKYEPGLMDLVAVLNSEEEDAFSKYFTKANYHTLVNSDKEFKFVYDGMIFEGKSIAKGKSQIRVYSFNKVVRGPYKLDVNWMALLSKHSSLFSIRKGPVLLEKSMKHARRDKLTEIDLFKKIEPQVYEQL